MHLLCYFCFCFCCCCCHVACLQAVASFHHQLISIALSQTQTCMHTGTVCPFLAYGGSRCTGPAPAAQVVSHAGHCTMDTARAVAAPSSGPHCHSRCCSTSTSWCHAAAGGEQRRAADAGSQRAAGRDGVSTRASAACRCVVHHHPGRAVVTTAVTVVVFCCKLAAYRQADNMCIDRCIYIHATAYLLCRLRSSRGQQPGITNHHTW